jgi:hypothetical protein
LRFRICASGPELFLPHDRGIQPGAKGMLTIPQSGRGNPAKREGTEHGARGTELVDDAPDDREEIQRSRMASGILNAEQ